MDFKTTIKTIKYGIFFAGWTLVLSPVSIFAVERENRDLNIILVIIDCLRADHLSYYGYNRNTTPKLDALASGAVVFSQAVAQAPTTLLSFASIFTSKTVSSHGVNSLDRALSDSELTLAEILKIYNYKTAAFVGGLNLNPAYKLDQGFDKYFYVGRTDASFRDTAPVALAWAKERQAGKDKFFMVVHGNDLHTPYVFPETGLYTKEYKVAAELKNLRQGEAGVFAAYKNHLRDGDRTIALTKDDTNYFTARYDEGVRYTDALVGDLIEKLKESKILAQSVLIITADHGEGLFDHDYFFHEFNLYDDTLRVPLFIMVPGAKAQLVRRQVRLIDLMPTILNYAGVTAGNSSMEGVSLKGLISGAVPVNQQPAVADSSFGGKVLRQPPWKLLLLPDRTELYNIAEDPAEKNNLAPLEKKRVQAMSDDLNALSIRQSVYGNGERLRTTGAFSAGRKNASAELLRIYKELRLTPQRAR